MKNRIMSGTPKQAGTFPVSITATDSASGLSASAVMDLEVSPILQITPSTLPSVVIGGNFSVTLQGQLITSIP